MSRRAIHNLNIMYPDVTAEQLRNYSDTICIICREEMSNETGNNDGNQQIKKLPCDHIFHKSCLRSWFQRQQTCPTCRTSILRFNNQPQHQHQQQPAANQQAQPQPAPQQQPAANQAPTANPSSRSNGQAHPITNPFMANNIFANQQQQNSGDFMQSNLLLQTPFALPPFAFMPPPLPPLNLNPSLSLDELNEMEGNERHNVESRIHCLRNISVLLNASMVQMNQYMNMCAATSHLENLNSTRNTSFKIENDLKLINNKDKNKKKENENKAAAAANVFEKLKEEEKKEEEEVDKDSDAIRHRRLQHFQNTQ